MSVILFVVLGSFLQSMLEVREMENISIGPTFGDFVIILTEGSMQDIAVTRLRRTRVQTPLSSLF
jgi:hypothetical protein